MPTVPLLCPRFEPRSSQTYSCRRMVASNFCKIHKRARESRGTRNAKFTLKINYRPCHASLARARVFGRSLAELLTAYAPGCSASVLLLKLQRCDKPSLRKSLLHINSTFFRIPNYFAAMNRKSYPIRIIIRVHQFWLRIISSMARIRNHKRRRKRFPFLEVLLVRA